MYLLKRVLLSLTVVLTGTVVTSANTSTTWDSDATVLDFRYTTAAAVDFIKKNHCDLIDVALLDAKVAETDILSVAHPISVSAVDFDLYNDAAKKQIIINNKRWLNIADFHLRETLAVHEYLQLMGIPDLDYALSMKLMSPGTAVCNPPTPSPTPAPVPTATPAPSPTPVPQASCKIDILFVIDSSGSMADDQSNMANNANLFVNQLNINPNLDFHIAFITVDMQDATQSGHMYGTPAYVDRNTPNLLHEIETRMLPGEAGSDLEQPFNTIQAALSSPLVSGANSGFLRADATLTVILLTDEDDQSMQSTTVGGVVFPFGQDIPVGDFWNFLLALKGGDAKHIHTYGIIGSNTSVCPAGTETLDYPSSRLHDFFTLSAGQTYDLCSADFGSNLAQIAFQLRKSVTH